MDFLFGLKVFLFFFTNPANLPEWLYARFDMIVNEKLSLETEGCYLKTIKRSAEMILSFEDTILGNIEKEMEINV